MKKSLASVVLFFSQWLLMGCCGFLTPFLRRGKSRNPGKGILFLENFPVENAGYQYRAAKWAALFAKHGIPAEVWTTCENKADFETGYTGLRRTTFMARVMWKRFFQCIRARRFGTVVVRRELLLYNDYGNLFMERFLLAIHPHVILDFDDDIGAAKREPRIVTSFYGRLMRENGSKFYASLQLYRRFVVGSSYLKELVLRHRPGLPEADLLIVPTCVDYDRYSPKTYDSPKKRIRIGWIGGTGNLFSLERALPALSALNRDFPLELKIISGENIAGEWPFPIIFKPWSLKDEVDDIKSLDIGLMPLHPGSISDGKCGFKLIQYMALGVVAVADAITANTEIIAHDGEDGFLVVGNRWEQVLAHVLREQARFAEIGQKARAECLIRYTFTGNLKRYLLFLDTDNRY